MEWVSQRDYCNYCGILRWNSRGSWV